MKTLKIVSFSIIIVFLGYFYLYIPTTLKVSTFKVSNVHELSVTRLLSEPKLLAKSMSSNDDTNQHVIIVNDILFKPMPALSNMVQIDIESKNIKTKSFITTNALNKETTAINWFFEFKTTLNPIQRWKDYQEAIQIKNATAQILNSLNAFIEQPKNLYGYDIKEVTLMDTVLITSKFTSKNLPTKDEIYTQADALIKYLTNFQKKAINNPMVTILENPTNDYTIMVGVSINGEIPETTNYRIKKMPVNGKMFVADVLGGPHKIKNGYAALKNYLLDSKRPSPAVPFELLVNDHRKISDTAQWVTRIYYPVM